MIFFIMRHFENHALSHDCYRKRADKSQFSSQKRQCVAVFFFLPRGTFAVRLQSQLGRGVGLNFARIHSFPEALWKYCPPAERTAGFHGR